MAPFLLTPRLTLRPLAARDVDAVFAMMSDDETMRFWDWPAFKDRETVAEVIAAQLEDMKDGNALYWAVSLTPEGTAIGSCGCFGREDTPPHWSHVALNAALAAVALALAVGNDGAPLSAVTDHGGAGAAVGLAAAVAVYLLFAAYVELPRTLSAARGGRV